MIYVSNGKANTMKVTREIADKVREFQELKKRTDILYEEIEKYFVEETDAEGFGIPFITKEPTGQKQSDEYCDQTYLGEDWYRGYYYHQIENSDEYVGYSFEN